MHTVRGCGGIDFEPGRRRPAAGGGADRHAAHDLRPDAVRVDDGQAEVVFATRQSGRVDRGRPDVARAARGDGPGIEIRRLGWSERTRGGPGVGARGREGEVQRRDAPGGVDLHRDGYRAVQNRVAVGSQERPRRDGAVPGRRGEDPGGGRVRAFVAEPVECRHHVAGAQVAGKRAVGEGGSRLAGCREGQRHASGADPVDVVCQARARCLPGDLHILASDRRCHSRDPGRRVDDLKRRAGGRRRRRAIGRQRRCTDAVGAGGQRRRDDVSGRRPPARGRAQRQDRHGVPARTCLGSFDLHVHLGHGCARGAGGNHLEAASRPRRNSRGSEAEAGRRSRHRCRRGKDEVAGSGACGSGQHKRADDVREGARPSA